MYKMKYKVVFVQICLDIYMYSLVLRTTAKVRERPQKCNFGSANKGYQTCSQVCFFFCFLQYLISIFNDIQHRYSRFMSRKTVFRSTKTAIFENIGLLRRSTCCFLDLLHIFNDFFHLQTTNIVSFLSL